MRCDRHHYEWRHGRFTCINCGHNRYSTHSIKNNIKIIAIILGIGLVGFFAYQNIGMITNSIHSAQDNKTEFKSFTVSPPPQREIIHNETTTTFKWPVSHTVSGKPVITISELEQKIHLLINVERQKNNISPLVFDQKLTSIARSHSQDMATRNYFEHDTPEGVSFSERYKQAGYICEKRFNYSGSSYSLMDGGENIYQNNLYNSYETVNGVISSYDWNDMDKIASTTVEGWMNSSGHRHNILTSQFGNEGVGIAISSDDKVYITEDFC